MYLQKFIFQVRLILPELRLFINDLSFHINYGEGRLISKLVNVHYTAGRAAGLASAVVQFGAASY